MTETEHTKLLDTVIKELIQTLDGHKQKLIDLKDECELHIQAVHERDLIIRGLRSDLEAIRAERDTWKAVAQCG